MNAVNANISGSGTMNIQDSQHGIAELESESFQSKRRNAMAEECKEICTMKRKPLRDTISDNQRTMEMYAKLSGKVTPDGYKELTAHLVKQKRERAAPKQSEIPLEADVSKAVAQYLAAHPKVKFAIRQNSGAARIGELNNRPIWFYRWVKRKGVEMRITDFWGLLIDGRMFAIEVKRPGWKKPTDQREREQANFIEVVGFGGFVTCIEDVERILKC